jgi:hypothetical protein
MVARKEKASAAGVLVVEDEVSASVSDADTFIVASSNGKKGRESHLS